MQLRNQERGGALGWIILVIVILIILWFIFAGRGDGTPVPPPTSEATIYTVTVKNISTDQPLSPGVFVTHTDEASLDFEGALAPAELEPLAEYGSHADFAALAETLPGVMNVHTIDAPIMPGQ